MLHSGIAAQQKKGNGRGGEVVRKGDEAHDKELQMNETVAVRLSPKELEMVGMALYL